MEAKLQEVSRRRSRPHAVARGGWGGAFGPQACPSPLRLGWKLLPRPRPEGCECCLPGPEATLGEARCPTGQQGPQGTGSGHGLLCSLPYLSRGASAPTLFPWAFLQSLPTRASGPSGMGRGYTPWLSPSHPRRVFWWQEALCWGIYLPCPSVGSLLVVLVVSPPSPAL